MPAPREGNAMPCIHEPDRTDWPASWGGSLMTVHIGEYELHIERCTRCGVLYAPEPVRRTVLPNGPESGSQDTSPGRPIDAFWWMFLLTVGVVVAVIVLVVVT
jgi:hypothetical protein